nr:YY1-associated factor 2 isoform X3 [Oryctolagus cuniculus]
MGDKKSPTRPKRQPKPSSDEGYWDCSVCTFRNGAEAFKCMMCDVRKGTSTRSTFFEVIVNASRTEGPLQFPISGSSGGRRQKSLRLHRGRESGSVRQRPNRRTPGPGRITEKRRQRVRSLLSAGSPRKWMQQPELSQSEARSQELLPGLPLGCRGQGLGPSSAAFPGPSRELDQK